MIQDLVKTWWSHALAALIVAVVFYLGRRKIMKLRRKKKQRKEWDSVGHNVVLLHQFQRGKFCPNLGPFALKVETFLRLAGIEYKVDTESPFGPKGKCPWITLNGEDLGDSEFILERLASEFDVDLDSHLDPQKAAALEAVRILADEHLFWCVITWRYWLDGCKSFLKSQSFAPFLRRAFPLFMKRGMKERARHHGIGKHSPEEIFHMCKKACRALSLVLGESPFFGGERPSTADCAIFGQLAQLKWNAPGSSYESIVTENRLAMEAVVRTMTDGWRGRASAVVSAVVVLYVGRKIMKARKKTKQRKAWDSVGHNVVLLHQFRRGKFCPNLSPFALKVETFLRLANVKYEVDTESPFGPKGKCPWITLNGEDLGDSEFILERLASEFDVDLDSHLDPQKVATLEAVRVLADEHLFWCVITWRYWIDGCESFMKSQSFSPIMSLFFPPFMKRGIRSRAREHGIGKHTPEEIYRICKKACSTLSGVLGESPFFGGERPSSADCGIFGQLAQLRWNAPGSKYEVLVTEMYPNLSAFCDRMKTRIYPDWNELLKSN